MADAPGATGHFIISKLSRTAGQIYVNGGIARCHNVENGKRGHGICRQ